MNKFSFFLVLLLLLACKASCMEHPENQKQDDYGAIMDAILFGNLDTLKCLVGKEKEKLKFCFIDGSSPLILAANRGYLEIVYYLLSSGVDATEYLVGEKRGQIFMQGLNALHAVCSNWHISEDVQLAIAKMLIKAGADPCHACFDLRNKLCDDSKSYPIDYAYNIEREELKDYLAGEMVRNQERATVTFYHVINNSEAQLYNGGVALNLITTFKKLLTMASEVNFPEDCVVKMAQYLQTDPYEKTIFAFFHKQLEKVKRSTADNNGDNYIRFQKRAVADLAKLVLQDGGNLEFHFMGINTKLIGKNGDWMHIDGPILDAIRIFYPQDFYQALES